MDGNLALSTLALAAIAAGTAPMALRRLALSRAKHRSLAGHSRLAKRVAALVPGYAYDEDRFFRADGAPPAVAAQRSQGLQRLAALYRSRYPRSLAWTAQAEAGLSDLQFTSAYRVPFQFSPVLRRHLRMPAVMQASEGIELQDLDGQRFIDLSGSYGVNVFGHQVYKDCIAEGSAMAAELGAVLGSYHPVVADNVARLQQLSGLDEVSFHMSGTEAVMQAVRLARYHTGKRHLVRFAGAYHGWWEDVQPGPGNPLPPRETYTLADMADASLRVLRQRRDIACVLVNPLQALHPNASAPGDSTLLGSRQRRAVDKAAYTDWLRRLRQVCTERGIVLIFDEVFLGFRLAAGGAQAYFGVPADIVTYGKTLGGGLPVGVVCGRAALMKRYREHRPADLCFARGTFNAHPYVMGAMNAMLRHLDQPEVQAGYADIDARWQARADRFNHGLQAAGLPLRVRHLTSVWTLDYLQPSRYHWMLQFYLRAAGLALSWVGTGRLIFSHNFSEAQVDEVLRRVIDAGRAMQADGWWRQAPQQDDRGLRRAVLHEMLAQKLGPAWAATLGRWFGGRARS